MTRFLNQFPMLIKKEILLPGSRREGWWLEFRQLARLVGRDGLEGLISYLKIRRHGSGLMIPAWWLTHTLHPVNPSWQDFGKQLDIKDVKGVAIIYSATPYSKTEGQRSTWLARAMMRSGWAVIYGYWRWQPSGEGIEVLEDGWLCSMPLDVLWAQASGILTSTIFEHFPRLFLIEFPHPSLFSMINIANSSGWLTWYEKIDDWKEFHRVGQASWYEVDFERYLVRNVQQVSVTANPLTKDISEWTRTPIQLIPNGYEAGLIPAMSAPPAIKGTITLGYFGRLTPAWFDWDLVLDLASRHPEWIFELIGPGEPPANLPENVSVTGQLPHAELADRVERWHVAIIPFRSGELSRAVDPIKVYEYLAMDRPVICSGMPQLNHMPYVYVANDTADFEKLVEEAVQTPPDRQVVQEFLQNHTWDNRIQQILMRCPPAPGLWLGCADQSGETQP